jgi:copper chaperone CopZ
VIIKIEGMTCGHCEGRVKAEFEKIGATVESVSAEKAEAIVSAVGEDAARSAVKAAGYKFVSIG